jgi:hypothetical protein
VPDLHADDAVCELERRRDLLNDLTFPQFLDLRALQCLSGLDYSILPNYAPLLELEASRRLVHRRGG